MKEAIGAALTATILIAVIAFLTYFIGGKVQDLYHGVTIGLLCLILMKQK